MVFGKYINRYYLKYAPALLLGLVALVAVDYLQLVVPELYGMVIDGVGKGYVEIDGVANTFDMPFLLDKICLPMIFVILGMVVGRFLWRICFFGAGIKVETDLRAKMFDHCRKLSHQYYQVNKVGNLMSLFTNDIDTVNECFGWGVMMLADALFLGVLAVIKMLGMDPILAGLSMIPMAILLCVGLILDKYMTLKWETRQEAYSNLSDFSQESFAGIAVIKAFVKEAKELMAFRKLNRESEVANVEYTKLSVMLNIFVTLLVESVICVILGYGGWLVYNGSFTAGQLLEFIGYFTAIVWPIMAISELIGMHSRGAASLKRITELLDADVDVYDAKDVASVGALSGDIEFKNLSFKYPDGELDALHNVSFKINAGENVGIVGKTGSGKTTVVDLILRTFNVEDGTLFLDGKDINTIPIRDVRNNCAYVPQDNFLFSDTIENNIAFATDNGTEEEVIRAAKMSAVDDNIREFSLGYKTVMGERGVTVSGGQKQRISIARALMKDAPILILDDSVSAVDVKTEREILKNLRELREGKTTVLIAHRVSTIENMDKIILIDDGKVIACGTHNELYKTCEEYRITVDLQKLEGEEQGNV